MQRLTRRQKRRQALAERRSAATRSTQTRAVYVHRMDWADVRVGVKREFRTFAPWTRPNELLLPSPLVIYCDSPTGGVDSALVVLEDYFKEPLGSIGPESLEREGFSDFAEFRRYVKERYPEVGFRPLDIVTVYRVRLLEDGDRERFGAALFDYLYGQFA